ncbi:bifunctional tetrahydrofolate synthase/dihydrofolate synthase [Aquicella lusitana]|uniref:Dihydrofolate synthase/folylpolyglutamate synthase n=1 Tax=Aquicella lusitana TaxID=254246 RepID=A0A370GCB9_9COXI|nr:bifunctional tetrahydrofolate synthase/dihydrofolate synthase [Aquicella lusitana]RDI41347.1 dihydrofolate synthase/folylpolyglutamate synthase [Aquicella lusitana]VVC74262.1 Bifunctional protein FolC [Aquicella lusitana]
MYLSTLAEWLDWIASIHVAEIELGLDRVRVVAAQLGLLSPSCAVIIVGGTNGKGSTVAGLESIYRAAGFRVGTFTSPILFKHNEQVRIDGREATDEAFCNAFQQIESARGNVSLTPFEFQTLAALLIFSQHSLDVMILEVGLGGRLDAVNILDADVAIITSIDIDHVEWLGSTRDEIAYEKAGIFRHGKPAVCGDADPPASLIKQAALKDVPLYCQHKDFDYRESERHWSWKSFISTYDALSYNALATQNMSTVLMAMSLLQERLPVAREAIDKGLTEVKLPGRIQIIPGPVTHIYDVSHNPAAVTHLAKQLATMPCDGKTHAVFSMLADKDITTSIRAIQDSIHTWYIAPLLVKRAATASVLTRAFEAAGEGDIPLFATISEAYEAALRQAVAGDRIIVFGSFHTVAEIFKKQRTAFFTTQPGP